MSEIKEAIELLSKEWSWGAVKAHPQRRLVLTTHCRGGIVTQVPTGPNFTREFKMEHKAENKDLRVWTKTTAGLIQWRTCPVKGDRLVYQPFGGKRQSERLSLEEIFMDPTCVEEGEVDLFKMLYADLEPLVPMFIEAMGKFDELLGEIYGKGEKNGKHSFKF